MQLTMLGTQVVCLQNSAGAPHMGNLQGGSHWHFTSHASLVRNWVCLWSFNCLGSCLQPQLSILFMGAGGENMAPVFDALHS